MIDPISAIAAVSKEVFAEKLNAVNEPLVKESPLSQSLETIESTNLEALQAQNTEQIEDFGKSYRSIESMGISPEEKLIYTEAGLEKHVINGRDALIQPNIDLYTKMGPFEETNIERMRNGYAPLEENGKQYQLHHIGQKMDSPLAELTRDQHCSDGNSKILHSKEGVSEINRREFTVERFNHWKGRARLIDEK